MSGELQSGSAGDAPALQCQRSRGSNFTAGMCRRHTQQVQPPTRTRVHANWLYPLVRLTASWQSQSILFVVFSKVEVLQSAHTFKDRWNSARRSGSTPCSALCGTHTKEVGDAVFTGITEKLICFRMDSGLKSAQRPSLNCEVIHVAKIFSTVFAFNQASWTLDLRTHRII